VRCLMIERSPAGERPGSAGLLAAGKVVPLADNRFLLTVTFQANALIEHLLNRCRSD